MDKRSATTVLLGLGLRLVLAAAATTALGQSTSGPATKRIGVLGFSNPVAGKAYLDAFADELSRLGWVEGRNLQSIHRYAQGDPARLDALAAELVGLQPDAVFTTNTPGALALQRVTRTIPIVMTGTIDPVALGLVKSLAHPGGNVTGTTAAANSEIVGKRLEILKEWLSRATRLAVIYNPVEADNPELLAGVQRHAMGLGLQVQALGVRNPADFESAFGELARARPDAVYVIQGATTYTQRESMCARLASLHVPSIVPNTQMVDAGCLVGYGAPIDQWAREGARLVDQILRGANPGDLPVRQPSKYELVINARTARALGLEVPKLLLLRADRVME